jgi:hypothetical protein
VKNGKLFEEGEIELETDSDGVYEQDREVGFGGMWKRPV